MKGRRQRAGKVESREVTRIERKLQEFLKWNRVRMAQGRVGDNMPTRQRYSQTLTAGRSWRRIAFLGRWKSELFECGILLRLCGNGGVSLCQVVVSR